MAELRAEREREREIVKGKNKGKLGELRAEREMNCEMKNKGELGELMTERDKL